LKSKNSKAAILVPALLFSVSPLFACGPWFPNNMLDRGDAAVLVAPVANFYHELDRMQIATPQFTAVRSTNSYADETLQTELADLRVALKKSGKSTNEIEQIVTAHLAERTKLQQFIDAYENWMAPESQFPGGESTATRDEPEVNRPTFPTINIVDGLPGEFADYFEGAIAWNSPNNNKAGARQSWDRLLNRPANERPYKSTWAAFMLGRSWESEDPQKARGYYKQVRALAAQGFSDPTGLAVASLGQEARVALRKNEFQTAIDLYLQQYAASGWGSGESLEVAISRAIHAGPNALAPLARNPQTRRLITAYLISQRHGDNSPPAKIRENTRAWLEAVEQAEVKDVESAEQFALAAYQADDMELALRWVNRAGSSPTAQWLEAKLLLRAGRVAQATELLSQIVVSFPLDEPTNDAAQAESSFASRLSIPDTDVNENVPAGRYIRGELGALRLSRREYIQSLDLLLRGNFREDAAYVADRVLTTDELKNYVDENWPAIIPSDDEDKTADEKSIENTTAEIRFLLARRLARENHGNEARPYYPPEQVPAFDQFMGALATGWDESLTTGQRAKALAAAAFIARTNGLELLGTETAPDWQMYGGTWEGSVAAENRTNQDSTVIVASSDELKRNTESHPDPDRRYHYRYQAASLALEASKLMPNNSDETARLLCDAGSWLKAQDPITADVFYKSLVRRCRKTDIGAEADLVRWFPEFDGDGNLVRTRLEQLNLPTQEELNDPDFADYPVPGRHYVAMGSDHIRYIAAAVRRSGFPMTEKEIFAANPEITRNDDITAREILIPLRSK